MTKQDLEKLINDKVALEVSKKDELLKKALEKMKTLQSEKSNLETKVVELEKTIAENDKDVTKDSELEKFINELQNELDQVTKAKNELVDIVGDKKVVNDILTPEQLLEIDKALN